MTTANDASDLLAAALRPESRAPDPRFVARVRLAIVEEERYRKWRKSALRRLGSDALILIGLAGPAMGAARILSADGSFTAPVAALMIATVVVGGWMALSGEIRRFQAA
jgi:hypothetical protein